MQYVIVTGATGAIGSEICRNLAQRGYGLILAFRNHEKAEALAASLPPNNSSVFLQLDLADSDSVHKAAAELPRLIPSDHSLKALINNAGVMASEYKKTPSGRELDMTVNYHNTVLWTKLLLQTGLMTEGSAIVFTTSLTRHLHRGTAIPKESDQSNFSRLRTYGASKRAITLYAANLHKELSPREIYVNCADPGIVDTGMITMQKWFDPITDILFRPLIRSPRKGAQPALRALDAALKGQGGRIFCRHTSHPLPSLT